MVESKKNQHTFWCKVKFSLYTNIQSGKKINIFASGGISLTHKKAEHKYNTT